MKYLKPLVFFVYKHRIFRLVVKSVYVVSEEIKRINCQASVTIVSVKSVVEEGNTFLSIFGGPTAKRTRIIMLFVKPTQYCNAISPYQTLHQTAAIV